uniref:Uncharacterized protein n=1 Tax=Anopheles minimus TaxID=112268 RepID=A0A182W0N2_9DIPT
MQLLFSKCRISHSLCSCNAATCSVTHTTHLANDRFVSFFSFVPARPANRSRKRRPSYSQDDREYYSINDDDPMDECNAALVLMSLSCSPNSSVHGCSGSSTTSWSTGSTSPPLSEDGHSTPPTHHYQHELNHHHHHHNGRHQVAGGPGRGARTTSLSTSDEGIGMEDMPRKRRVSDPKSIPSFRQLM